MQPLIHHKRQIFTPSGKFPRHDGRKCLQADNTRGRSDAKRDPIITYPKDDQVRNVTVVGPSSAPLN